MHVLHISRESAKRVSVCSTCIMQVEAGCFHDVLRNGSQKHFGNNDKFNRHVPFFIPAMCT